MAVLLIIVQGSVSLLLVVKKIRQLVTRWRQIKVWVLGTSIGAKLCCCIKVCTFTMSDVAPALHRVNQLQCRPTPRRRNTRPRLMGQVPSPLRPLVWLSHPPPTLKRSNHDQRNFHDRNLCHSSRNKVHCKRHPRFRQPLSTKLHSLLEFPEHRRCLQW